MDKKRDRAAQGGINNFFFIFIYMNFFMTLFKHSKRVLQRFHNELPLYYKYNLIEPVKKFFFFHFLHTPLIGFVVFVKCNKK